ncbi:hypothetical protein H9P43_009906 [Blastocladiella emersonii ATCC 22665]|nr:hypothetical protein H9P43_009906 [Blastocladiella emersonii ATCC 22665]
MKLGNLSSTLFPVWHARKRFPIVRLGAQYCTTAPVVLTLATATRLREAEVATVRYSASPDTTLFTVDARPADSAYLVLDAATSTVVATIRRDGDVYSVYKGAFGEAASAKPAPVFQVTHTHSGRDVETVEPTILLFSHTAEATMILTMDRQTYAPRLAQISRVYGEDKLELEIQVREQVDAAAITALSVVVMLVDNDKALPPPTRF